MPRGVYNRSSEPEPTQNVPQETVSRPEPVKAKVRKYQDHTIPLCLTCEHREDMHHAWKERQVIVTVRDLETLKMKQEIQTIREKDHSREKPCQHACKCTEYK